MASGASPKCTASFLPYTGISIVNLLPCDKTVEDNMVSVNLAITAAHQVVSSSCFVLYCSFTSPITNLSSMDAKPEFSNEQHINKQVYGMVQVLQPQCYSIHNKICIAC